MKMLVHIFTGALALAISLPAAHSQGAGSLDPAFNPNGPPLAPEPGRACLACWTLARQPDNLPAPAG